MNDLLEILKYTLPALIVFLTAFFILRAFMKNEEKKRKFELNISRKDSILPLRLQAYERLILFLERISPESIVMRMGQTDMSVAQLQNEMVSSVRTELEHNLAQQAYISNMAWELIKSSRTNIIRLINETASELKPAESGIALSRKILENSINSEVSPTREAIVYLKKELNEFL